jgi:hypothetical protein
MKDSEIRQKVKDGWIRLKAVFEVAGFPEEHIAKTVQLMSEKFAKEKGVLVIEQIGHSPKKVSDKMFSSFIESEFLVQSLVYLMGLIYDYMPSSVEIIEPADDPISDDPQAITMILNDLVARLHKYNQIIHALRAENALLKQGK